MTPDTKAKIEALLADPEQLLQKPPFYRRIVSSPNAMLGASDMAVCVGAKVRAKLPKTRRNVLTQDTVLKEYDPWSHNVLTDDNIPSITVKNSEGGWITIEQKRMPIPFQQNIVKKQTLHLCNNPMSHILLNTEPDDVQSKGFVRIKQAWQERNMDGIKTEAVTAQKSQMDVGVLFYHDDKGRINARVLSYDKGFCIITHKGNNGEHILECVYYEEGDTMFIDCYDEEYMYRLTSDDSDGASTDGWVYHEPVRHGFSECPLCTKRGPVAWDNVQDIIEVYERTYNTFMVIQNRYGWGVLYVKGKFNNTGQKVAGNVVLNDTSMNPEADAKILTPPSPQNMIETLDEMEHSIQKGSGSTFILPKDIKLSGDTSGIAVQLTQELDIETALQDVKEWQNFANKMMRLFKEGLARELVNSGEEGFEKAVTDFKRISILSQFSVWRPQSNEAYNQMLATLHGAGGISQQTLIEKNTESCPDELVRVKQEAEEEYQESLRRQKEEAMIAQQTNSASDTIITE